MKNFNNDITNQIVEIGMNEEIEQKVEDMGVVFERLGRTPMSGRVFAYLLLADPHYQPFDDIVEFLGASKSAVSNALTLLQQDSSVSYVTFSGDRKRYFKIDTHGWLKQLKAGARNLAQFNDMLKGVYAFRKENGSGEFNKELLKLLDFQNYLSREIDNAIEKWSVN